MDIGAISERTVYNWHHDYENNGCGFSEGLLGKAVSTWILDNPTMYQRPGEEVVAIKDWPQT